jgi:hypothetical protein
MIESLQLGMNGREIALTGTSHAACDRDARL